MVGDRLETDMKMARDAGLAAVLLLSGVAKMEDVERLGIEPDVVLSGVGEIAKAVDLTADYEDEDDDEDD